MKRWQCPIHKGTLETFIWSIMWKIWSFVICLCSSNAQVIFVKKTKINSFSKFKTSKYNSWLEKALKETILNRALTSLHGDQLKLHLKSLYHSCLPSPLVPDPIRVQSCVWYLFWTNRNFYLSHHPIRDESLNRHYTLNGHIYFHRNWSEITLKVSLQINFMLKGKDKAGLPS